MYKIKRSFLGFTALSCLLFPFFGFDFPDTPPIPERRPEPIIVSGKEPSAQGVPGENTASTEAKALIKSSPPFAEEADDFAQCTAALSAIGAEYEVLETIDGPGQCGIEKPLKVNVARAGVVLSPAGTMRCETALALAQWAIAYVEPSAKIAFGDDVVLTEIRQASTYACRKRNSSSTGKISEHAKGNAVDIRAVSFSNGNTVDMVPRKKDGSVTGAFQRTISASACLYFTTVLSPGSDATHQDHMHLDIIQRKRGYRYCR